VRTLEMNAKCFQPPAALAGPFAVFWLVLCLALSPLSKAENSPPHASADRMGEVPVGEARSCSIIADFGAVHILPDAPNATKIRYIVHLETDAQEPLSQSLFDRFILNIRSNSDSVTLNGYLPRQHSASARNSQFWVQYTVYVPANFSVNVHTGGGDIETGDIAIDLGLPTNSARRILEDLEAHGLVTRFSQGDGKPHLWNKSTCEADEAAADATAD